MKHTKRSVYRRLKEQISFSRKLLVYSILLSLCVTAISTISPYLYKILVDDVMTKGNAGLLYRIIPAMIAVYLVKVAFTALQTYVNKKFANLTGLEVKRELMKRFLRREMSRWAETDVGRQSANLEQDSANVQGFLTSHVAGYLSSFIITAIYFVLMLGINVWLGLLSIVLVPGIILFAGKIGKLFNGTARQCYEVQSKTNTHLFHTIQRWREIKANTLEERFSGQYDEMLEPERKLNIKWMRYYGLNDFVYAVKNGFVMEVLIYFVGGLFIILGHITIGELLMFIAYMESMSRSLDALMQSRSGFLSHNAVFDRLFEILEEKYSDLEQQCPGEGDIAFHRIDFTYEASQQKVFEQASFTFRWGKKYLMVGKSGEGKSTLIKLLLGMNHPQKGELLVGDIPVRDINSRSLLKHMGVVMQESVFFNLTIRENLMLVAPKATEAALTQVLSAACLDDFIEDLPAGLDTVIGERGIKLSGGQKQRLAIARLILYDPQIVILDEATSALDSVVENRVMENLSEHFAGKTMIVISHKPLVGYKPECVVRIEEKKIESTMECHLSII